MKTFKIVQMELLFIDSNKVIQNNQLNINIHKICITIIYT